MSAIRARLDAILPKLLAPSFRENKGLGNEIGYYIFDYEPEYEMLIRNHVTFLQEEMNTHPSNQRIIVFDLYDIILEIMDNKGYLQKNFQLEEKKGSHYVLNATRKSLRLTLNNDLVIQYMKERVNDDAIIFITGVGRAFPIIRSHVILNNVHKAVGQIPVVMFFPGKYNGQDLQLFGEIKDDNYYRAFQLVDD